MKKYLLILSLLALAATAASAQQSNKSKSKDRYREKDTAVQPDTRESSERLSGLRLLAESELPQVVRVLSDAVQQNGALPAVGSRYFGYALLAGHETNARFQSKVSSLQGALRGMPIPQSFINTDAVFHPFAALWAVLETGRNFFPSNSTFSEKQAALEQTFRDKGLDEQMLAQSKIAAQDIARSILEYAASDGFQQLASTVRNRTGINPTAVNPEVAKGMGSEGVAFRPFFMESAQPFALAVPMPFDTSAGSAFMMQVREVYETGQNQTVEQRAAAEFWDTKINTLSGQWLAICSAACAEQKVPFNQAMRTHAVVAIAMADAYLVCWEEQGRNRRELPQTVINRTLDTEWKPLLEGSAGLEYASDHSVVSAAAAEVLTRLVGDKIAATNQIGGLSRRFTSFRQAAAEASASRLYGGVQYRDVLDAGLQSGRRLGEFVVRQLPVDQ